MMIILYVKLRTKLEDIQTTQNLKIDIPISCPKCEGRMYSVSHDTILPLREEEHTIFFIIPFGIMSLLLFTLPTIFF